MCKFKKMKVRYIAYCFAGFLLVFAFFLSSCKKEKSVYFKLSILIPNRFPANVSQFPADFVSLCKPIQTPDRTKFYMPTPISVHRLSNNFTIDLRVLRANATNYKSHVNQVDAFFIKGAGMSLPKELSQDLPSTYNEEASLKEFFASLGTRDTVFYYSESPRNNSIYGVVLFGNVDTLKAAILNLLAFDGSKNIHVVYNPTEEQMNLITGKAEQDYNNVIASADLEFGRGNYDAAKRLYFKANAIKNDEYASKQIAIIIRFEKPEKHIGEKQVKAKRKFDGSLMFSYAKYNGDVVNGQPCGDGTLTFYEAHELSENDNRKAEKGDKIVGYWVKGKISHGKWFSQDGVLKGKIFGGTNANCD
jgi:hypothetical protein